MALVVMETELGEIRVRTLPEAAPETVTHFKELCQSALLDFAQFYRSDFVIQFGLHGTGKAFKSLKVNETNLFKQASNERGTLSFAHWDVPDCGNSEIFINLKHNAHLDKAYGGYCVFARVEEESLPVVDAIAAAIASGERKSVRILKVNIVE